MVHHTFNAAPIEWLQQHKGDKAECISNFFQRKIDIAHLHASSILKSYSNRIDFNQTMVRHFCGD